MREPSRENLNALGKEYCSLPPESSAQRKKLKNEIAEMGIKLLSNGNYTEAWAELFLKDFPKFDATKGTLSGFLSSRLKWRAMDIYYEEAGMRRVKDEDEDQEDMDGQGLEENAYLQDDAEDEKQEALTLGDIASYREWQESPHDANARDVFFEVSFLTLIQLALNFSEHLTGKANNSQRRTYFKLFFTDDMVWIAQNFDVGRDAFRHEKELLGTMKLPFLDYFMTAPCRSVEQLRTCRLKKHGEVTPGKPMKELQPHYLPNDVYKGYINANEDFELRSDGAISNQRDSHRSFFRDLLR